MLHTVQFTYLHAHTNPEYVHRLYIHCMSGMCIYISTCTSVDSPGGVDLVKFIQVVSQFPEENRGRLVQKTGHRLGTRGGLDDTKIMTRGRRVHQWITGQTG